MPDLVLGRKVQDLFHRRDPAGVRHGRAHVVDELVLDQRLVVPHGVEDLADGEWRRGVLPDETQGVLALGRCAVFEPEQVVRFERLAELGRLDGRHPVVPVVEQGQVGSEFGADGFEHGRQVAQALGAPVPSGWIRGQGTEDRHAWRPSGPIRSRSSSSRL